MKNNTLFSLMSDIEIMNYKKKLASIITFTHKQFTLTFNISNGISVLSLSFEHLYPFNPFILDNYDYPSSSRVFGNGRFFLDKLLNLNSITHAYTATDKISTLTLSFPVDYPQDIVLTSKYDFSSLYFQHESSWLSHILSTNSLLNIYGSLQFYVDIQDFLNEFMLNVALYQSDSYAKKVLCSIEIFDITEDEFMSYLKTGYDLFVLNSAIFNESYSLLIDKSQELGISISIYNSFEDLFNSNPLYTSV